MPEAVAVATIYQISFPAGVEAEAVSRACSGTWKRKALVRRTGGLLDTIPGVHSREWWGQPEDGVTIEFYIETKHDTPETHAAVRSVVQKSIRWAKARLVVERR